MEHFTKMTKLETAILATNAIWTAFAELQTENKRLRHKISELRKERDEWKRMSCVYYEMHGNTEKSSYEEAVMESANPWEEIVEDVKEHIQTDLEAGIGQHIESQVNEAVEDKLKEVAHLFKGDWVLALDDAFQNADTTDGFKEACRKQWLKVAGEVRTWELSPNFISHINTHLESDLGLATSSRNTAYGQVASCFKHLRIAMEFPDDFVDWPEWRRFTSKWEELKSKVSADTKHKVLTNEQLKQELFVSCRGKCLTTEMLQQELDKRLAPTNEIHSTDFRLKTMFLSFYAYHGLRPQDWNVMLKDDDVVYTRDQIDVANDHTHGYVSLGNKTITLWTGKCVTTFPERIVPLHPKVVDAIHFLHDHEAQLDVWDGQWLCYETKDRAVKNPTKYMRDMWSRKRTSDGKYTGLFPGMFDGWKGISLTNLRKLWEVHIRQDKDPHSDEVKKLSGGCGHAVGTAEKHYMEYIGVYELNVELDVAE